MMDSVVFVFAFGSRGDVLPVMLVLTELCCRQKSQRTPKHSVTNSGDDNSNDNSNGKNSSNNSGYNGSSERGLPAAVTGVGASCRYVLVTHEAHSGLCALFEKDEFYSSLVVMHYITSPVMVVNKAMMSVGISSDNEGRENRVLIKHQRNSCDSYDGDDGGAGTTVNNDHDDTDKKSHHSSEIVASTSYQNSLHTIQDQTEQTQPHSSFYSKAYFADFIDKHLVVTSSTGTRPGDRALTNARFVLTNFFALEGWIMSTYLNIPCVILHPNEPPAILGPRDVQCMIRAEMPQAHETLLKNSVLNTASSAADKKLVTLEDMTALLWPSLSDHYDSVRQVMDDTLLSPLPPPSPPQPAALLPVRTTTTTTSIAGNTKETEAAATIVAVVEKTSSSGSGSMSTTGRAAGDFSDVQAPLVLIAGSPFFCGGLTGTSSSSSSVYNTSVLCGSVLDKQSLFHSANATLDVIDTLQKPLCQGCSAQPHYVLIDFGSMTEVIANSCDITVFLNALLEVGFSCEDNDNNFYGCFHFVIVSHGFEVEFYAALDKLQRQGRAYGCNGSSSSSIPASSFSFSLCGGSSCCRRYHRYHKPIMPSESIDMKVKLSEEENSKHSGGGSSSSNGSSNSITVCTADVNHWLLLNNNNKRMFACMIHHGGVGTVQCALLSGVPQVVVPIMYDQRGNAERLCSLGVAPAPPLDRDVLFPLLASASSKDGNQHCDLDTIATIAAATSTTSTTTTTTTYNALAVNQLNSALAAALTPISRLRCACIGKRLRENPAVSTQEDGLSNCINQIETYLCTGIPKRSSSSLSTACITSTSSSEKNSSCCNSIQKSLYDFAACSSNSSSISSACGALKLHCHHIEAPEETSFLFDEVIVRNIYFQHGISLFTGTGWTTPSTTAPNATQCAFATDCYSVVADTTSNDEKEIIIVDVGANVGFFSLKCLLDYDHIRTRSSSSSSSNNSINSTRCARKCRIIAIEPALKNFELLVANMSEDNFKRNNIQAAAVGTAKTAGVDADVQVVCVRCAVGRDTTVGSVSNIGTSAFTQQCELVYLNRFPGNSFVRRTVDNDNDNDNGNGDIDSISDSAGEINNNSNNNNRVARMNSKVLIDDEINNRVARMNSKVLIDEASKFRVQQSVSGISGTTHELATSERSRSRRTVSEAGPVKNRTTIRHEVELCKMRELSDILSEYIPVKSAVATTTNSAAVPAPFSTAATITTSRYKRQRVKEKEPFPPQYHPIRSVDLLKIDVEGSEMDVLNSIANYHWPMIQQIVIEVALNQNNAVAKHALLLKEKGYTLVVDDSESFTGNVLLYARRL